jgi:hypothetical protein
MEVLYCPLFVQGHNSLVLTKCDCNDGQLGLYSGHFNDVIAFGATTTERFCSPSPVSPISYNVSKNLKTNEKGN